MPSINRTWRLPAWPGINCQSEQSGGKQVVAESVRSLARVARVVNEPVTRRFLLIYLSHMHNICADTPRRIRNLYLHPETLWVAGRQGSLVILLEKPPPSVGINPGGKSFLTHTH